jgi:hypothetical protein
MSSVNSDINPAASAQLIVLAADSLLPTASRGIYVGTSGDLKVDMLQGGAITFTAVLSGTLLPIRCTKVYSTGNGTTATNIVALF